MTAIELQAYKKILVAKSADLGGVLRNRDGIGIEKSPDALDEVQRSAERELAIRTLDRDSSLLRDVRTALLRIEDKSYGTCLHCEEEISVKRLSALPSAPYCISCQEQCDAAKHDEHAAFNETVSHAP